MPPPLRLTEWASTTSPQKSSSLTRRGARDADELTALDQFRLGEHPEAGEVVAEPLNRATQAGRARAR